MQTRFYLNASGFTAWEREHLKHSIIKQARAQALIAQIISEGGNFRITLEGDCLRVVAYETAILAWLNERPESLRP